MFTVLRKLLYALKWKDLNLIPLDCVQKTISFGPGGTGRSSNTHEVKFTQVLLIIFNGPDSSLHWGPITVLQLYKKVPSVNGN